jgi:5-methylcytosine-specific restriction endonuclease McrA
MCPEEMDFDYGWAREDGYRFKGWKRYKEGVCHAVWLSPAAWEKCKQATINSQRKYPERVKARWEKFYRENSETVRERRKANYWETPEESRRKAREDYHKNRDERVAAMRVYRDNNRGTCSKASKNWTAKNRHKKPIYDAARRARMVNTSTEYSPHLDELYKLAKRVSGCLKVDIHVDHIVPLVEGGAHSIRNVSLLPGKINSSKHSTLPHLLPEHIKSICLTWAPPFSRHLFWGNQTTNN